ncbi:MAG: Rieske (2Fe-2S) protein [Chitinispirillaceae bacterium]|nr:Rieske (2Fe-2S) protein [Chitinispirillaceae bacterium]
MEMQLLSRRKFCATTFGASFGLAAAGVLNEAHAVFGSAHEVTIDLTLNVNSALTRVGGAMYVTLPTNNDKMIVVRNSSTQVSAFTSVCTHEGCQVNLPVNGVATCPCHGSRYSDTGTLIQGPAPTSLRRYFTQLQGNFIYIDSTAVGVRENKAITNGSSPEIVWRNEGETLNLSWGNGNPGRKIVSLFDVQGRRISRYQWEGNGSFAISTRSMPRGEYVVMVEGTGGDPVVRRVRVY